MSRELFKSMTYKDGKVFTRQCSNNVSPKYFDKEEDVSFTKLYNELGEAEFEKYFITNGLLEGYIEILSGCNKVLRRLSYLENLLYKDKDFKELRDNENMAFDKMLSAKTDEEKSMASDEYKKAKEDIKNYVSSFYDTHNSKYKDKERER